MQQGTDTGFLYVAFGKRYLHEALISARSLKRFTQFPVCVITDQPVGDHHYFDMVINAAPRYDFVSKIIGMQMTPFKKTVFLDTDTFVCSSIDNLFDALELFDMALTVENFLHSYEFIRKYNPEFFLRFEKLVPEFNTGVIVYRSNEVVTRIFKDWLDCHEAMHVKTDMPAFREAYLKNVHQVSILTLPFEYNYFGTKSFGFVYNEIKVIHERLGERWNTLTSMCLPFEKMDKVAKRMNKYTCKRIIVPYLGVIPYNWNPYRLKYKIKQLLGIKMTKKADTF